MIHLHPDIKFGGVIMQGPSKAEIWKMFDAISQTYDKANRWMTLGLDVYWRKKVNKYLPRKKGLSILDCATGTGDQILALLKNAESIEKIFGIDLSEEMLEIGRKKIAKTPLSEKVFFQKASILSIPYQDSSFDLVTISFGIRNVTDVSLCLEEIKRVLKPGGKLFILETSTPKSPFLKKLHLFYIRKILPKIGGWISQKKYAYEYLNETAERFPSGEEFCILLRKANFMKVQCHPMAFGAVSLYTADKSHEN
jgi:demethylmenaquinone methyltransferase / 2-methoxy-6-polyprenyl-1,4-benzoquinol methylase